MAIDIDNGVRKIIADTLGIEVSTMDDGASIIDDLGADSLDMIEISMSLEEIFHVLMESTDMENMETVSDVIRMVHAAKARPR